MKSCNRRIISVLVCLWAGCNGEPPGATSETSPTLASGDIVVSPGTGWGDTGVTGSTRADGSVDWCCTTWIVPLPVAAGDVIGTVTVNVRDNGPNNGFPLVADRNSVTAMVGTPSATGFNALTFATTAGNGDAQSITLTLSTPHVVAEGENLQFRVRAQYPASWPPVPALHASWVGLVTIKSASVPQPIGALQTLQISPATSTAAGYLPWSFTVGSGGLAVALPMRNGDQIVGLRARLRDVPGMAFALSLQSVVDGDATSIASSPASTGGATKQTLSVPGLAVTVVSGTNYQASIDRLTGSGLGSVYWIEADVIPQ